MEFDTCEGGCNQQSTAAIIPSSLSNNGKNQTTVFKDGTIETENEKWLAWSPCLWSCGSKVRGVRQRYMPKLNATGTYGRQKGWDDPKGYTHARQKNCRLKFQLKKSYTQLGKIVNKKWNKKKMRSSKKCRIKCNKINLCTHFLVVR